MDLKQRENELNRMILEGKALDAFEKFYAEDVVMQEGPEEVFEGKDTNRQRENEFFASVEELRDINLHDVAFGDGVTMSTWTFDYTHSEWGDVRYDQVAVREWDDSGRITRERFIKDM